eukprot:412267-Pyramimonas_sp.AAC.2
MERRRTCSKLPMATAKNAPSGLNLASNTGDLNLSKALPSSSNDNRCAPFGEIATHRTVVEFSQGKQLAVECVRFTVPIRFPNEVMRVLPCSNTFPPRYGAPNKFENLKSISNPTPSHATALYQKQRSNPMCTTTEN